MHVGWVQLAFEEDLVGDVLPVDVAGHALVAVGVDDRRVFEGRCPHRGAHLGYGGLRDERDPDVVVCPFHGHRVRLGVTGPGPFCVREYSSVRAASGLFALLDEAFDTGLADRLRDLDRTHYVRPAFAREVAVPPEFVVENVLDVDHFTTVHGVDRRPRMEVSETEHGSLVVSGRLELRARNQWQVVGADDVDDDPSTAFRAEVFSPSVVVTALGPGATANVVITAATSLPGGGSTARVSVALPRERASGAPTVRELSSLVSGSRTAFDQDAQVWDHLDVDVTPHYVESDALVRRYRDFCDRFRAPIG